LHNLNKLTKSIIDNRRLAIAENPDIVNNGKRKSFLVTTFYCLFLFYVVFFFPFHRTLS